MSDKLLVELIARIAALSDENRVLSEFVLVLFVQRARAEPEPERFIMQLTESIRSGFDSVGLPEDRWANIDATLDKISERARRLSS